MAESLLCLIPGLSGSPDCLLCLSQECVEGSYQTGDLGRFVYLADSDCQFMPLFWFP